MLTPFFPTNDRVGEKDLVFPENEDDIKLLFLNFQRDLRRILNVCEKDNEDVNFHVDAHLKLAKTKCEGINLIKFKNQSKDFNFVSRLMPCSKKCRALQPYVSIENTNQVILISLSSLPVLMPDKHDLILTFLSAFHCFCFLCVDCFCYATRSLTQFSKKCNDLLFIDWPLLCHGENLAGYNLQWTKGNKDDAIRDWCSGTLKHNASMYETRLMSNMVKLFPGSRGVEGLRCKTFVEYIQNSDEWLTSGSGSTPKSKILLSSGEVVTAKKNKTLWALNQRSAESIREWILGLEEPMPMHCADKVELGRKERLIIVAGEDCLILFGYIHYFVTHVVRSGLTPLFFSSSHFPKFWFNLMILCKNKHVVAFPYDAPNFDQGVSRMEWRIFFGWIYVLINRWGGNMKQELLLLLNKCQDLFFKLKIKLPESGKIIAWEKGVPSGIRFTALADTVINMARQGVIYELLVEQLRHHFFCNFFGLGDDILLFLPSTEIAKAWFDAVNHVGFGANSQKNWTSHSSGEFLKRVINKNTTRGYVLRRLGGHAFRDPTKAPLGPGRERMEERLSSFLILADRRCDLNCVFQELCFSLRSVPYEKIKLSKATELARSPRFVGGCGLTNWNERRWLGWVTSGDYTPPALAAPKGLFASVASEFKSFTGVDVVAVTNSALGQRLAAASFAPARLCYSQPIFVQGDVVDPLMALFHSRDAPTWSSRYPFPAYLTRHWFKSCLSQHDYALCLSISSEKSRPIIEIMLKSWRHRDICLWVDGKLDLGSAVILGCGSDTVNYIASFFRRKHFERLLAYHRVDSKHIEHSTRVVERSVHLSLKRYPNRIVIGK